jgi:hypothetical protein
MKKIIFILILFAIGHSVNAQNGPEAILVQPLAFDRFFWLLPPVKPKQIFIVEVQNTNSELLKVIYFAPTDGFRGGKTDFIDARTLNGKTLWKLKLRIPSENEKIHCKADNYLRTSKGKIHTNESGEPILRFRSTQIEADIKFNNLSDMSCMILDSFSN